MKVCTESLRPVLLCHCWWLCMSTPCTDFPTSTHLVKMNNQSKGALASAMGVRGRVCAEAPPRTVLSEWRCRPCQHQAPVVGWAMASIPKTHSDPTASPLFPGLGPGPEMLGSAEVVLLHRGLLSVASRPVSFPPLTSRSCCLPCSVIAFSGSLQMNSF